MARTLPCSGHEPSAPVKIRRSVDRPQFGVNGNLSPTNRIKLLAAVHELGHTLGFTHPMEGSLIPFTSGGLQAGAPAHRASALFTGVPEAARPYDDEVFYQDTFREHTSTGLDVPLSSATAFPSFDDVLGLYVAYPSEKEFAGSPGCRTFDPDSQNANLCNDPNCPCGFGHGDCDSDAQCATGLECNWNVGPKYGMGSTYDVCLAPRSCPDFDALEAAFCGDPACPCGVGEGLCRNDAQCGGALLCGKDNMFAVRGPFASLYRTWDMCVHPPFPGCPYYRWDDKSSAMNGFCTDECPCSIGQGDCDRKSHCQADLVCAENVGEHFGFSSSVDICAVPGAFPNELP